MRSRSTPTPLRSVALRLPIQWRKGIQPTSRELPGIETSYDFSGEGVLVRVWRKDTAQLQPLAQSVTIDVAKEKLRLIGYDLHRLDQAWRQPGNCRSTGRPTPD